MLSTYFLFFLGLFQAAILPSKFLQLDISSKFFLPSDLLKAGLVNKNWIGVEQIFNRITPNAGLFENKQTKEIFFESKNGSIFHSQFIELFGYFNEEIISEKQTIVEERKWDKMFFLLAFFQIELEPRILAFLSALAEIVNIDGKADMPEEIDETWFTNIHLAVFYFSPERGEENLASIGNSDLLEILLRRPGANPNIKDEEGETPLHFAAVYTNIEAINILVSFGGNINAQDMELKTPLMHAMNGSNQAMIEAILNLGGDPKMKDVDGETCLHKLSLFYGDGFESVIDMLLDHKADIDEGDNMQRTPLMVLVDEIVPDTCKKMETLLKKGADVNLEDKNGHTAISHAFQSREPDKDDKFEILLKYGAKYHALTEIFKFDKFLHN